MLHLYECSSRKRRAVLQHVRLQMTLHDGRGELLEVDGGTVRGRVAAQLLVVAVARVRLQKRVAQTRVRLALRTRTVRQRQRVAAAATALDGPCRRRARGLLPLCHLRQQSPSHEPRDCRECERGGDDEDGRADGARRVGDGADDRRTDGVAER